MPAEPLAAIGSTVAAPSRTKRRRIALADRPYDVGVGLKQLNAQVNDLERRRPALMAFAIGVLICVLMLLSYGSWALSIALGACVGVGRLLIRPIVARRSSP